MSGQQHTIRDRLLGGITREAVQCSYIAAETLAQFSCGVSIPIEPPDVLAGAVSVS
jgi:hypothetical protein